LLGLIILFIPTFIALKKGRPDKLAIIAVNTIFAIFILWASQLGWVATVIFLVPMICWSAKLVKSTDITLDNEQNIHHTLGNNPQVPKKKSKVLNLLSMSERWLLPICIVLLKCVEWAFDHKPYKKTDYEKIVEAEDGFGEGKAHWWH
jgi:Ca2+/Na+ antiporter